MTKDKKEEINENEELPDLKLEDLDFSINLAEANYELDALQNELLNFYIRSDFRFKMAFSTNYTQQFIKFMKDKARLKEPISIATIGNTRSGKSYSMMSLVIIHSLLNGRQFDIRYICGNSYEFIEKLKELTNDELHNSIWLIDEEKKGVFGAGSVAKKLKFTDVQNIIAINNISTISLTPDRWSNESANYGLRSFGRDFLTKSCRFMLYNLSEGGRGSSLPMGMIYLPIFTKLLPKRHADILEKQYLQKKNEWVNAEMRGEGDVLSTIKKKTAEKFVRDEQFLGIKKKNEKMTYINTILGSEWSKSECEEVYQLTEMLKRGIRFDE